MQAYQAHPAHQAHQGLTRRLAALALSALFTVAMLMSMDGLATSPAPAGLVAQMAHTSARA